MRTCVRILFKNTRTTRLEKDASIELGDFLKENTGSKNSKHFINIDPINAEWEFASEFYSKHSNYQTGKNASIELCDPLKENTGPGSPKHFNNIDPINEEWELASEFYSKTLKQPDWEKMQVSNSVIL